jgi:hypothetical protein
MSNRERTTVPTGRFTLIVGSIARPGEPTSTTVMARNQGEMSA